MKVRTYVVSLTSAGFLGASVLGVFLWWIFDDLKAAEGELDIIEQEVEVGSRESKAVDQLESAITDALYSLEVYPKNYRGLFGEVRRKLMTAKQAHKKLSEEYAANYTSEFPDMLSQIQNEILEFENELKEIEDSGMVSPNAKRPGGRRDGTKILEAKSNVTSSLEQIQELDQKRNESQKIRLETKRLELQSARKNAKIFPWIAILLYVGFTVFLAWWTYRSLARPIQTLEKAASSSFDEGKPFIMAEMGPTEIRTLAGRLRVLVHSLEEQVSQRTQALRTKAHELEQEMLQRKELETQLVHAQKMEAVGQLAAGIAHEINSPSQFVNDNVTFLRDAVKELLAAVFGEGEVPDQKELEFLRENAPESVEQALQGMERITTIVKSMKNFAYRDAASAKKPQNLNQAITATSVVATNEWKYHAELELDLDQYLPLVPCNIGEINQVILNLIVNAAHAIRDSKPEGEKGLIVVSTKQYDQYVVITIQDNGGGIPEHVQGKIFEPFFTTKDVGVGTGQGLAIAHNVITKSHGGHIWFETEQGTGTTFFIRLSLDATQGT